MASTQQLLNGLIEYQKALDRHLRQLNEEFSRTENQWRAFSGVYEGDAADQFRVFWQREVDTFHEYFQRGSRISAMLAERIEYLRQHG